MSGILLEYLDPETADPSVAVDVLVREEPAEEEDEEEEEEEEESDATITMMTIKMTMMATRSDVCSNLSYQDLLGGDEFGRSSTARG